MGPDRGPEPAPRAKGTERCLVPVKRLMDFYAAQQGLGLLFGRSLPTARGSAPFPRSSSGAVTVEVESGEERSWRRRSSLGSGRARGSGCGSEPWLPDSCAIHFLKDVIVARCSRNGELEFSRRLYLPANKKPALAV
ncbi:hypothetical protein ISCGN_001378 [Ixodes scapularis]